MSSLVIPLYIIHHVPAGFNGLSGHSLNVYKTYIIPKYFLFIFFIGVTSLLISLSLPLSLSIFHFVTTPDMVV